MVPRAPASTIIRVSGGMSLASAVFRRAAAAVAGETGAFARDQDPGALIGGRVGLDFGDGRFDGDALFLDVLRGRVAARDREGVGLQDDDRSALDALRPRGKAGRPEKEGFFGRLDHLAEPGAAVEADRHFAGLVELGLEPPLLELPDRPFGRVVVGVRARFPAAEPVAGIVVPGHDLVVGRADFDDLLDDGVVRRLGGRLEADDGRRQDEQADQEQKRAFFHLPSDPGNHLKAE